MAKVGILYCKRGMFERAEERLRAAVQRLTYNHTRPKHGEALYYLGVALRAQSKHDEADDAFHRAAWSFGWYAASHYALA